MVHKHRGILNNRNAIFSLCELSLDRMWRHFSLDKFQESSAPPLPAPVPSLIVSSRVEDWGYIFNQSVFTA